jgi:opacity protein-like surface antigen
MLRRSIAGAVAVALFAAVLAAHAADKEQAKDAKAEGKEVKGEITKIDKDKMTFKLKTEDGKTTDYKIEDATKFVGPKGGAAKEGIKDDRFVVGAPVTLVLSKDGKKVEEIHLPNRSDLPKKTKSKEKA